MAKAGRQPETTVARWQASGEWSAACRDCKWLGPNRGTVKEAKADQIAHIEEKHPGGHRR